MIGQGRMLQLKNTIGETTSLVLQGHPSAPIASCLRVLLLILRFVNLAHKLFDLLLSGHGDFPLLTLGVSPA